MAKPIILITSPESAGELEALQKAHVSSYTRKDGTFVKEHDTSVTAKPKAEGFGRGDKVKVHKPGQISHGVEGSVIGPSKVKPDHVLIKTLDGKTVSHHKDDLAPAVARPEKSSGEQYDHPNVVGHAENLKGGDASKAHGMHFAGKEYSASGKEGKSFHDDTPVRHFREVTGTGEDDGEHVWMDHSGRVHADDTSSVKRLRGEYEAHKGRAGSADKPKSAGGGDKQSFSSHADARRKIADSAGGKVGARIVQHDDELGLSSVSHRTSSPDEAKSAAHSMGEHLESHGFQHKERETGKNGSHEVVHHHYLRPSGAMATVSHSSRMSTAKGKSIAGASLEIHSGVKDDEKAPWHSKS